VKEAGVIRIGYANEVPFAYVEGDKLTGYSPEMMRAFAKTLGIETLDGVLVEWAGLIPALQADRIDVIAAGMAITPERCKQVIFSEPEITYGGSFIVKKGNPLGLTKWKDVADNPNARMGMISGTGDVALTKLNGIQDSQVTQFPDQPTLVTALQGDRIDAAFVDTNTAKALIERSGDPNLELALIALEDYHLNEQGKPAIGWGAVVFRPEDAALRDVFNTWLAGAKQSGELKTIIDPFGFGDSIAPAGTSVEELCTG
jgi:polar amino acid transport system substrate-binding protein